MNSGQKKLNNRSSKRSGAAAPAVELERRALALPKRVVLDAERALFRLRETGQRVSFSALVEVALSELLSREDLGGILEQHGATARRRP
jgi:hypothetical protein